MPLIQPRLKFVGVMPVDAETLNDSIEFPYEIPPTLVAAIPFELVLGQFNSRNSVILLDSVQLIAQATIAQDPTNYTVITIVNRGPAGAGTAILASWSTLTGAQGTITAYVPVNMVIPATSVAIQPGDVLTINVTKSGTGVNLSDMACTLKFKQ